MRLSSTRRLTYLTMLSAMAITLNIIESSFIGTFPFGIRVGLANVISLITVEVFGSKEVIIVNIMRVFIGNLLRGLIFGSTFWIGLNGVILSTITLLLTHKLKSSLMFSSIVCSIVHSLGQVMVVIIIYNQVGMVAVVPYLLLGSIPMGIITGLVADRGIKLLKKNIVFK